MQATCDTGSWPEQHTSTLQPGPEGIGPAREHPLCKATLTRRHGGSTGLPIWHLAPSSHQPLRPSTAAAAESAPCKLQQAQGCSVGSNCPPILHLPVAVTGCPSHQQTNRPAQIHRQTDLVQAIFPRPRIHASRPPVLHPVCHRGLTPSSPRRVGDNLQFRCEVPMPTPPGPHIDTTDDLVDDHVPLTSIRVSRPPRLCAATRFAWATLAAHDRSARTTTIPTATQSALLG